MTLIHGTVHSSGSVAYVPQVYGNFFLGFSCITPFHSNIFVLISAGIVGSVDYVWNNT
jgi:hypothetical protein